MNPTRPRLHIRDILKFTAIVCLALAVFSWTGLTRAFQADWPMSVVYPLALALLCAASAMRTRVNSARCQSCGKRISAYAGRVGNGLCPACRVAKAPPEKHRRLAIQGFTIIVGGLLMLSFGLLYPFTSSIQGRLGGLGYPIAAIGLFLIFVCVLAAGLVLRFLMATRRMNDPDHALSVARACGREPGRESTFGPVTVHVFGTDNPSSMLQLQWELSRTRFESLIGERIPDGRELRVFVFGTRNSFDMFFRRAFLYTSNLDGMFVPWSTPTIAITKQYPAYRLADPERTTRILFSYVHLDSYRKRPTPLWLQMGIAHVVASGGDRMESARLNRTMLAAFSRGDSLGKAEFFHISQRLFVKLVRDWRDFASFRRYSQLVAQSCSVAEFLCSDADRLQRFRAFLGEPTQKSSQEEIFQRHFDHGFEIALERWRSWVLERGIGAHSPPPPEIRDALMERVLPIVEDENADAMARIQAIRDMGRTGYVTGADALIDLLGMDNQVPAEEIIWSLESISGLALGNQPERWIEWFDRLPGDARRVI
jgi:hypothetical protein